MCAKSSFYWKGQKYELIDYRGNHPEADKLLDSKEERWPHPDRDDPQTLLEWFRRESGASRTYVSDHITKEDARVFFLLKKGRTDPIGFFSLVPWCHNAILGSLYVRKDEGGKGLGTRLVAKATRISYRAGYKEMHIPEMTAGSERTADKAFERPEISRLIKKKGKEYDEGDSGPYYRIKLLKRLSRKHRRAARKAP